MKKKAQDATGEEIICDLTHWEDPDTVISLCGTKDGGVYLQGFDDWQGYGAGPTMKDALLDFAKRRLSDKYFEPEYQDLDWSDIVDV